MLVSAKSLIGKTVLNISGGGVIGYIAELQIDVTNMKVLFLRVTKRGNNNVYLLTSDIRDISVQHVLINSETNLSEANELVRHRDSIRKPCLLIRYKVVTTLNYTLGTCDDYVFDSTDYRIAKINVKSRFWQRILTNQYIIDANDIIKIHDKSIIVRDNLVLNGKKLKVRNPLPARNA